MILICCIGHNIVAGSLNDSQSIAAAGDMGQVSLTLNGRTYRLACGDGDEPRLDELSVHLSERVDTIVRQFGQIGDDRTLLMAAIMVADDYFETREELDRLKRAIDQGEVHPKKKSKRG